MITQGAFLFGLLVWLFDKIIAAQYFCPQNLLSPAVKA